MNKTMKRREMEPLIWALGILSTFIFALFIYFLTTHNITAAIWTLFTSIVIFALAGCLYWQQQVGEQKIAQTLEEPTFRERIEDVTFSLGAGGVHSIYKLSELERQPKEPFYFGGYIPVKLYVEDGKLYADVKLYGGAELPPVEIIHNEYVVRPKNWDINKSQEALEVVNEKLEPVFQLIYAKPSHIIVNGIFPYPGGLVLANESGLLINPTVPTTFTIKRIFKYPSWKYPGKS
jgi:hypothetical protein